MVRASDAPDAPARQALTEYFMKRETHKRKSSTHLDEIDREGSTENIKIHEACTRNTTYQLCELTKDRDRWRAIVREVVLAYSE